MLQKKMYNKSIQELNPIKFATTNKMVLYPHYLYQNIYRNYINIFWSHTLLSHHNIYIFLSFKLFHQTTIDAFF